MPVKVTCTITRNGFSDLSKAVQQLVKDDIVTSEERVEKAFEKTVSEFASRAQAGYAIKAAAYGTSTPTVFYTMSGKRSAIITGTNALFLEYGTGIKYSSVQYPEANPYGPGTWSLSAKGKGHWDDPNGWYDPMGKHHYGNPPVMVWYYQKRDFIKNFRANIEKEDGWRND